MFDRHRKSRQDGLPLELKFRGSRSIIVAHREEDEYLKCEA